MNIKEKLEKINSYREQIDELEEKKLSIVWDIRNEIKAVYNKLVKENNRSFYGRWPYSVDDIYVNSDGDEICITGTDYEFYNESCVLPAVIVIGTEEEKAAFWEEIEEKKAEDIEKARAAKLFQYENLKNELGL